jgi:hypothetical protein
LLINPSLQKIFSPNRDEGTVFPVYDNSFSPMNKKMQGNNSSLHTNEQYKS